MKLGHLVLHDAEATEIFLLWKCLFRLADTHADSSSSRRGAERPRVAEQNDRSCYVSPLSSGNATRFSIASFSGQFERSGGVIHGKRAKQRSQLPFPFSRGGPYSLR